MAVAPDGRRARSGLRQWRSAVPLALVVTALVSVAMACGGDDAGSSGPDTLHMQYVARTMGCGTPEAIEDPNAPGRCIMLGDSLFGPSDFTNPVVKHDAVFGQGVQVTLTSRARAIFVRDFDSIASNAEADAGVRLTFVFDGQPLRWTLLPGPDANLFIVAPDTELAERIVRSIDHQ
jgi:hypothetical protein